MFQYEHGGRVRLCVRCNAESNKSLEKLKVTDMTKTNNIEAWDVIIDGPMTKKNYREENVEIPHGLTHVTFSDDGDKVRHLLLPR